jgi:uncharacterized circularly permuted ATP-grasp superfamily protein
MARRLLTPGEAISAAIMSRLPYDEMRSEDGIVRPLYQPFGDWLARTPADRIAQKREEAERAFHRLGITFAVA